MAEPFASAAGPLVGLLSSFGGLAALYDETDRLRWANACFRDAFGLGPDDTPTWADLMRASHGRRQGVLIQCSDFEHWLASAASRRGKEPTRQFEADLQDGRWIMMTQTTDERGWMLEIGVDVSDMGCDHRDLRVARDRAVRASQEDALTGIPNRAAVLTRLDAELAVPGSRPCIALVDLDHFKRINDTFGHPAGDQVLRDFAVRLRDNLRRGDACGRFGGEEFLLVLQDISLPKAADVLHRLLVQTRAARPLREPASVRYTFSAGLVQARPDEGRDALLARADAALYDAKRQGRDRCEVRPDDGVRQGLGDALA